MSNRYWAVGIRYWAVGTRYCAIRFDVRYLAVGIRYWAVCIRSRAVSIRYYRYHIVWRRDSLLVRMPDSRSNACEFESRQKWRENFFFRVNFVCWLFFNVFIRCPFHPRVTAVARKRPRSFCQKWRWQVTPKTRIHPWPYEVGVGWLHCCPGIVWGPIRKWAHTQLVREHSATVTSARWATVDWSWNKEWK